MLSIRTVLCPVDFSASTARQVDLAVDLCRAFGARLILQHNKVELAIGAGVGWMWEPSHAGPALTPEQQLKEMLARVPAGTDAEMRLTRGPIVDAVVTVSRAVGADLVVLSARGGDGDDDDSITDRLLESASLPIFAVHDALHEHRTPRFAAASGSPQALLVPTDFTPASQPAVDVAFDLSRRFAFDVHLLHVLPKGAPDGARRRRRPAQDDGTRAGRPAAPAAPPRRDRHSRSRDRPRRRRRGRGLRRHGRARTHNERVTGSVRIRRRRCCIRLPVPSGTSPAARPRPPRSQPERRRRGASSRSCRTRAFTTGRRRTCTAWWILSRTPSRRWAT